MLARGLPLLNKMVHLGSHFKRREESQWGKLRKSLIDGTEVYTWQTKFCLHF